MRAALLVLVLAALAAPPAAAQAGGGAGFPDPSGGAEYGAPLRKAKPIAPVARLFAVAPSRVTAPRLPRISLRIDQPGARSVVARLVFWPQGPGAIARVDLGRVRTGRTIEVTWPEGLTLRPGRYVVRVHARGRGKRTLARAARHPGRAPLTVVAPPAPPPPPAPARPSPSGYVFPVAGPHTIGGGFGEDRGDHRHEGQDISAAEGVPLVAPIAGTVAKVAVQPAGAGHYVVLDGADGRSYFFAHCQAGSVAVTDGAAVAAGAVLCGVGSTGRSSGPHLHFEIWVGGWRRDKGSRPIDPLPELRAWAAG